MNKQLLSCLFGGIVVSSAFAYATRSMSVVKSIDATGHTVAMCSFSPDTGAIVSKYNLYVVWGDVDAGRTFASWGQREQVAEITPETDEVTVQVPEAALRAKCMRLFLAEPTLAARTDGIEFVDYVQASEGGVLVGSGYTPNNTTAIDCEFEVPNTPDNNAYYTIFCARNTEDDSTNHKTYTLFLHRDKNGNGYTFRLDYGKKASTETTSDLGFAVASRMRLTTAPTADGSSLTATLVNGKSTGTVMTNGDLSDGAGNELSLFGCYSGSISETPSNTAKIRFYGFRATEGESLRLNLIPAKKTETVESVETTTYGLYDTVSGNFKSSLTKKPLSGSQTDGGVASFCESSELFLSENESGVERGLHYVPLPSTSGDYVNSVAFSFPDSDSPIPFVLTAVTPDGVANKVADVGTNAMSVVYRLPPSRGNPDKATVRFRLEPDLPAGYELLPYVEKHCSEEGTSGAYITTDYKVNGTTSVQTKMRFLEEEGEKSAWAVFCSRSADTLKTGDPGQALFAVVNNNLYYWRYDYGTANGANVDRVYANTVYTFRASVPGGLQVSSEKGDVAAYVDREAAEFTAKGGTMLFASYKSIGTKDGQQTFGDVGNNRRTDIYWFTMVDADGEVFTFVPVRCTAGENEGKVGFYDFVDGRFVESSTSVAFVAPTTEEKSPLVIETEAFTAPEMAGMVMVVY